MTPLRTTLALAAALCAGLVGVAFAAAPHACEGGLTAYGWAGVAGVLALLAVPLVRHRALPVGRRALLALGLGALGAAAWVGGLLASDMQILCRLL